MINQDIENVFIDLEAKKITESEALRQLVELGVDRFDAKDQLEIYHGGDLIEE